MNDIDPLGDPHKCRCTAPADRHTTRRPYLTRGGLKDAGVMQGCAYRYRPDLPGRDQVSELRQMLQLDGANLQVVGTGDTSVTFLLNLEKVDCTECGLPASMIESMHTWLPTTPFRIPLRDEARSSPTLRETHSPST